MTTKILEIRDEGTRIDVLATKMHAANDIERYYLNRSGYSGGDLIVLMRLADCKATYDLYDWKALGAGLRTMQTAHQYINRHFDELSEGAVVDVQFILGETTVAKVPERERVAA